MTSQSPIAERTFTVVQGPDRLDILSAFANYSPDIQFGKREAVGMVYFIAKVDGRGPYAGRVLDGHFFVMISSVQHKDDSGKSWNIEGYLTAAHPVPDCIRLDRERWKSGRRVQIHYRVDRKEGTLRIL